MDNFFSFHLNRRDVRFVSFSHILNFLISFPLAMLYIMNVWGPNYHVACHQSLLYYRVLCRRVLSYSGLMIDGHCVPCKIIALAARNLYHLFVGCIFKFIGD